MGRARRVGPPARSKKHGSGQKNQPTNPRQPGLSSPLTRRANPRAKTGQPAAHFPFPSIFLSLSLVTIPIPFLLHPRRWPRTRTKTVQPIHHFASLFHRDLHHFASLLHRDIQHVAGQEHEGSAAARERSAGRTQSHHRTPIRGRFRRPRPPRRQVFAF
ncbi:hypothetical protein DEO72_LG1g1505 [Vigna unguiculata]|uniref:Uncharacterized protein n=1 Tax=Vigna unguiculata TaxID=3917 RepID=A0A4D6KQD0_VIGUN|nr:hypothetical protein DEO72_LG1g1505 [Vigna unguiculata]